jgi:hypothetical protein
MSRNLEQGVQAIQNGKKDEGARLIRIALKDEQLPSNLRAVGLLWLAETNEDAKFKIECYRLANQADPTNTDVSNRLSWWMSRQLPDQKTATGSTQQVGTGQMPTQNPNIGGTIQPAYGQYQQTTDPGIGGGINPQYGQYQQGTQNPNYGQQPQQQNPLYPTPIQTGNTPAPYQPQRPATGALNPNYGQQNVPGTGALNPNYGQQNVPGTGALNPNYGQQPIPGTGPLNPNYGQPQPQNPYYPNPIQTGNTPVPFQPMQSQQRPGTGPLNPNYGQQNPLYQTNTGNTSGMMPVVNPNMGDTGAYGVQPAIYLQQVQRTVGILDGPNGVGTGFFVTRNGLIATTRYVVGGEQKVKVELLDKRVIEGIVVRSFPEFDLALIQVNVRLEHLLSVNPAQYLPDNAPLIAVTHTGQGLRSTKRATRHEAQAHWFPTLINHLIDAGGNPIFSGTDNLLVGMLTKNASRNSGYMYGLHISKIYQCVELYHQEAGQITGNAAYCPACGVISRAPGFGGYYCENCGNTLPYALDATRYPQLHLMALYGETKHQPCPNCGSQAGFYKHECLRCGFEL